MDAPREVFVVFDESFNSIEDVYTREHGNQDPEAHEVKFVRADLAPSAQPSEASARERRLAEAERLLEAAWGVIANAAGWPGQSTPPEDWVIWAERWRDDWHRVLASPEAPVKAWVEVSRGLFGDGWYVSIQGVTYPVQMVGAVESEALALRMAGEIADALGLEVRR